MPAQLMGLLAIGTFYLTLIVLGMCAMRCLTDERDEDDSDSRHKDGDGDQLDLLRLLETSLSTGGGASRENTSHNLANHHNNNHIERLSTIAQSVEALTSPLDILTNHLPTQSSQDDSSERLTHRAPRLSQMAKSKSVDVGTSTEVSDVLDTTVDSARLPPFPNSSSVPVNLTDEAYYHRTGTPATVRGIRPLGSPLSFDSTSSKLPLPLPTAGRFLLADRNIGWMMGTLSMLAIKTGGIAPNAIAQEIYSQGFLWCQLPFTSALSVIVGGTLFARAMYSDGYVTIIDPFQNVYGARVGVFLFIPVLIADLFSAAVVISSLGSLCEITLGLSPAIGICGSVCAMVCYLLIGGLYAGAFTDAFQYAYILFALLLMLPSQALTVDHVRPLLDAGGDWLGDLNGRNSGIYIDQFSMLILGGVCMQSYFQRVFSSRSLSTVTSITWISSIGCLLTSVPTILIGLSAKSADWSNTTLGASPEGQQETLALQLSLANLVPSESLRMLVLGCLASGVLASCDSALFGLSTIVAQNLYKNCYKLNASSSELIIVSRVSVVVFSVLVGVMCLLWHDWHYHWLIPYDILYVFVFPQLFCVVYFKYSNTYGAVAGTWAAMVFRLCIGEPSIGFDALLRLPFYDKKDGQQFPYRTLAMLCNLLMTILASTMVHFLHKANLMPSTHNICRDNSPHVAFSDTHNHSRAPSRSRDLSAIDNQATGPGLRRNNHLDDAPYNNVPLTISSIYRHTDDRNRRHSPLIERMTSL